MNGEYDCVALSAQAEKRKIHIHVKDVKMASNNIKVKLSRSYYYGGLDF